MSADEYRTAERLGEFRPRPGQRIHAASHPDRAYADGPDAVTLRFTYRDDDGWRAKWGKELYAVTDQAIPFDRAVVSET